MGETKPCSRDEDAQAEPEAMARADLRRVARARRNLEAAKAERDDAIRAAVASGETYRDVARMAGVNHARIGQIVHEGDDDVRGA